jgi:4-amino-4-deoxy-L-arabinose transferase-like glycosyltransferase
MNKIPKLGIVKKMFSRSEIGKQSKFRPFSLMHLIYLLALLKFVLPFIIQNGAYEPHRDEFLYIAEGQHMAWGYLEVPPMMSVFAFVSNVMGGSLFWIKIWPSLFGALTFILTARLILSFGGKVFALFLGFLPFIFGYYLHVHFMFQPNYLEVFFWTLMAYGLVRYVQTGAPKGLYIAGIGLGLGMMSKYSVGFFAISLLVGLLLTKQRKILRNKHFYYALLIGFAIFLPNLIWQYSHGLPVIYHMKELQRQQLQNVSQLGFLIDQLLFNFPCIYIWSLGLYWVSFTKAGMPYRFIGIGIATAIALLVAGHGKSYYGMGAYPILFVFGALCLERWTKGPLLFLRYLMLIFTVAFGCFFDTISLPFLPPKQLSTYYANNSIIRKMGFLRWEDQKDHLLPQDFADMLSWKELTEKIAKVYSALDSNEKKQAIIDCDNYGEEGAVNYYGPPYHLPALMGHGANFLLWVPSDFYKSNVVILSTDYREEIHAGFIHEFRFAAVVDSICNPYAREFGSYIILLKGPSEKFRRDWQSYYESLNQKTSIFH